MPDAMNSNDRSEAAQAAPSAPQERCGDDGVALQFAAQRNAAPVPADEGFSRLLVDAKSTLPAPWRHVLDTMNEGLLLVTSERRVAYLNQRAERLIGRSLDDVQGQLCTDAINCPQCSCACRLFELGGVEDVEVTIHAAPDAAPRLLRKNARLLHDTAGQIVGGVETFQEIDRPLESRDKVLPPAPIRRNDRAESDEVPSARGSGVFRMDLQRRVVQCTDECAQMLGFSHAGAAIGRDVEELLGVPRGFLGALHHVDGRTFVVPARCTSTRRTAALSFRRERPRQGELLAELRWAEEAAGQVGANDCEHQFQGIVSQSPRMWEVFRVIECVARSRSNVLIEGESGVGKELVAQAIHRLTGRPEEPFYAVNCAAFTGDLLLNELFGHERGAFTGAIQRVAGKLEMAGEGTLFLDEVSEIPIQHQAVLLRVLETRRFERLGGHQPIELGARIISATNRRLCEAVEAREFRKDLYFRLRVVPLHVPPLRERPEDIPLLAEHFAIQAQTYRPAGRIHFTQAAMDALVRYPWPGNVRELRNLVEYFSSVEQVTVDVGQLPAEILHTQPDPTPAKVQPASKCESEAELEYRDKLLEVLRKTQFRKQDAARLLGIDRTTLWRQMKRFGL